MLGKKINILSIPVDVVTMEEAVDAVFDKIHHKGFHLVATANAEMLMLAHENNDFASILRQASLIVPDGAGALWAAEQQGESFPERVTGADLAVKLMNRAAKEGTPIYCMGSAPGVVDQAIANVTSEVGPLNIVGTHSGFFTAEEEVAIVESIKDKGAKLVFVALGVPKQEYWLMKHLGSLDGVVGIGVGGTFDVLAGNTQRAPMWMQNNRLEWLYRLLKQPSRLGRMLALPKFVWTVKRYKNHRL